MGWQAILAQLRQQLNDAEAVSTVDAWRMNVGMSNDEAINYNLMTWFFEVHARSVSCAQTAATQFLSRPWTAQDYCFRIYTRFYWTCCLPSRFADGHRFGYPVLSLKTIFIPVFGPRHWHGLRMTQLCQSPWWICRSSWIQKEGMIHLRRVAWTCEWSEQTVQDGSARIWASTGRGLVWTIGHQLADWQATSHQ